MLFIEPRICIFDLEYTDVALAESSATLPEIYEIGGIVIDQELKITREFQSLVCPRRLDRFTPFSSELTGISFEEVERSIPFSSVWKSFTEFTENAKLRLCSWGIHADIPILKYSYYSNKLGYPHNQCPLDAFTLVYAMCRASGLDYKFSSLDQACAKFGFKRRKEHRALADCMRVLSLFREIKGNIETLEESEFGLLEF